MGCGKVLRIVRSGIECESSVLAFIHWQWDDGVYISWGWHGSRYRSDWDAREFCDMAMGLDWGIRAAEVSGSSATANADMARIEYGDTKLGGSLGTAVRFVGSVRTGSLT